MIVLSLPRLDSAGLRFYEAEPGEDTGLGTSVTVLNTSFVAVSTFQDMYLPSEGSWQAISVLHAASLEQVGSACLLSIGLS